MPNPPAVSSPGRHSNGRFGPGNPGRPAGSSNRVARRVAVGILEDFEAHQEEVLERLRSSFLPVYVRLVASLLPKSVEVSLPDYAQLSDDDLDYKITALRQVLQRVEFGDATLLDLEAVLIGQSEPASP